MSALRGLLGGLSRLNAAICALGLWAASLAILGMAILVAVQVFFRYVLNNSLSWVEDVSLMMLAASAFLIMPYALRHSLHMGVDLLRELLPAPLRFLVEALSAVTIICLSVFLAEVSWQFTAGSSMMANAVPIKMQYIYGLMPLSFALLVPVALELAARACLAIASPEERETLAGLKEEH
ncbi:TRAP transporter small permease [Afifella sp. IM 167]|uniref:TRAP transporter small permease n=1 Tax=Afifella sp. IM 167 TaxID=2033586 RepID=UPI001CCAC20E|nr:TRAP transporter small permease subunit [Afifella sp. IM 167]MBZ8131853.1 hypothetical protein [Afifella sp. IM 167]